jgi:hypothetical protein
MRMLVALGVFCSACSGSEKDTSIQDTGSSSDERLVWVDQVDTELGLYHMEFVLDPIPAIAGPADLEVAVSINNSNPCFSGAALVNANLSLTGRRPEEGGRLGTPIEFEELGHGDYRASWTFAQAGYWELEIKVGAAEDTDIAVIGLIVGD